MIGYQPGFRPLVRAYMAQTPISAPGQPVPKTVPVPAEVAASTADALATSGVNRNLLLISSGLSVVAGSALAYNAYNPKKGMKNLSNTTVALAGLFALLNLSFFTYVVVKG